MTGLTTTPWSWKAQGEANEYVILSQDGRHWVAAVQLNGELLVPQQEAHMALLAAAPKVHAALRAIIDSESADNIPNILHRAAVDALREAEGPAR